MQFVDRHIGPTNDDVEYMLSSLGYGSLSEFISDVVPANIAISEKLTKVLPLPVSETEAIEQLRELASHNKIFKNFIGMGYYGTITPPVILRNVLENPAWYTAYTPYQPEISQGRLEALFAFQTMITDLVALDIANASMLDEGTAAAEAMTLALRTSGNGGVFLVDENVHPQTLAVITTRALPIGITVKTFDPTEFNEITEEFFGVLLQYPNTRGELLDHSTLAAWAKDRGAVVIAATDLLALTLIKAPGEWGADVAVGSAQRFGVPMGFGGPHAGFMAVRRGLERSLPGRLVGQSIDSHGAPAFRLALQTREQHIRREKATSNICTAQVLLAEMAAFYAMWHGPLGLKQIATRVHNLTARLAASLVARNPQPHFFDTITFTGTEAEFESARARGINIRRVSADLLGVSCDETTTEKSVRELCDVFGVSLVSEARSVIPQSLHRTSHYLTHPIFNSLHNETAMMRYLRKLSDRDLALDRTMIPLGSCTMKLNAVTEMEPVTWNEFAAIHPFAPADQSAGSRELIKQLSNWLISITGYDAVSLQPNAGSQGEFAGLLAIRKYLDAHGGAGRTICLIPSSAHGTNAASAVMAGMKVVVVACDDEGNVSVEDIKSKIAEHRENLAALMVTYPSTHGVFEEAISEICARVHDAGGQVYVDGANLNALVGLAQPGKFGADVSHLNLHKTFCIPHGGGGPGVGPVIARAHLAPYLPNHPLDPAAGPATGPGPISAAPFGSASILPISWAYIAMMGGEGLTRATEVAILSANYIAAQLTEDFPVLYTGRKRLVAHECILDLREITKVTGVTVDDVAKRLMDFGFHAPTMSFPVPGTLMVEPTESEDLNEIHRFIQAMRQIAVEIDAIRRGEVAIEQSALRHAPHTAANLLGAQWERPYSRENGAYPLGLGEQPLMGASGKYWPPVGRIDGAHGDRNLICACPPIEEFQTT